MKWLCVAKGGRNSSQAERGVELFLLIFRLTFKNKEWIPLKRENDAIIFNDLCIITLLRYPCDKKLTRQQPGTPPASSQVT